MDLQEMFEIVRIYICSTIINIVFVSAGFYKWFTTHSTLYNELHAIAHLNIILKEKGLVRAVRVNLYVAPHCTKKRQSNGLNG